ncbi:MAG: hypothetical protein U9N46_04190 [Euryarchaeota archaeon]|nr:hypothetical protein [Euryarchaeota archaeon]
MRYLYQDSIEVPVQRNFVQDMRGILEVSEKVCPLEGTVISAKKKIEESKSERDEKISRMRLFESDFKSQLSDIAKNDFMKTVEICKKSLTDLCASCVREQIAKIESEYNTVHDNLSGQVDSDSKQIHKLFEEFLGSGVYSATRRYVLSSRDQDALHGKFTADVNNDVSFTYKLWFRDPISIKELVGSLFVPTWGETGIFHKENVVKMLDISNHRLVDVECTDKHVNTTFESRKGEEKVSINMKRDSEDYSILYCSTEVVDITKDKAISEKISGADVVKLMRKVIDYVEDYGNYVTSDLETLTLGGCDVVEDSLSLDALEVIFGEYGRLARECMEHSVAKNELIIKIESDDRSRTEQYISLSEIKTALSQFDDSGAALADAFGLSALETAD